MFLNTTLFVKSVAAALLLIVLHGCDNYPEDPSRTFEKAEKTGLIAGYVPSPPWVIESDSSASGIEGEIIKGFAEVSGMKVIWHKGSEQELMEKLEKREIHIVICGLTKDNPWKSRKIGLTMPYHKEKEPDKIKKKKHIIAVIQGENRFVRQLEKYMYDQRELIERLIDENKQ
jgi:polar amino acid transport system substrate-binding protein